MCSNLQFTVLMVSTFWGVYLIVKKIFFSLVKEKFLILVPWLFKFWLFDQQLPCNDIQNRIKKRSSFIPSPCVRSIWPNTIHIKLPFHNFTKYHLSLSVHSSFHPSFIHPFLDPLLHSTFLFIFYTTCTCAILFIVTVDLLIFYGEIKFYVMYTPQDCVALFLHVIFKIRF